nr:SusE domain-containing protein [uncultured Acetobacteroides sp.]
MKLLAYVAASIFLLAACDKDETKVYISETPTAPVLSSPQNESSFDLTKLTDVQKTANFAQPFTWSLADYGFQASIQYQIQFSKNADMSKAKVLSSVNLGKTYTPTNLAFDEFLIGSLRLTPKVAAKVYYRIVASTSGLPSSTYPDGGATTAIQSMTVTPFNTPVDVKTWGIVGSATPNKWDGPDFMMDDGDNADEYVATVNLVVGEIKFRFNNSWDKNLGGSGGVLSNGGSNIPITVAGTYTIKLNTKALTYSIVKL